LLYVFASAKGIVLPAKTDDLFPLIATQGYLSPTVGILFVLGLIAAAYSSADSALTALTTSFTIDLLNTKNMDEDKLRRTRQWAHIFISVVLIGVILLFNALNDKSVIDAIFTVAGYTYGPLLGLFAFGLFTRFKVRDIFVPAIAIISPVICLLLSIFSVQLFNGYKFGFELLIVNGFITFVLLYFTRIKGVSVEKI
jgi:Na+/proline symporter